jgi:PAS domain S-box-containing protein
VQGASSLASNFVVPLFWTSRRRPAWVRYGVALILVVLAACWNYLLPPVYGETHYFFFSVAILASALFGDLGPGLLATGVSALTSAYLFIAPFHSFRIEAPEAAERLAMFVVEGTIISSVGHLIRNNRTPELTSALSRYSSALALVASAAVWKLSFLPKLERRVPFTYFYSAVVATSWVAGAGPGLVATALSAVCVHYLFSGSTVLVDQGNPAVFLFALEATALCLLTSVFRERLIETEAHLGRVFEDSPLGIVIFEGSPRILKANPAFCALLHADSADLEGCSFIDLVHPDSVGRVQRFLDHLARRRTVAVAEEVCLVRGIINAWTNLHGSWIRQGTDAAQTCLVMIEDLTERRKAEEALRETEARLQQGQKMEAIGMLAGGIAHDFNSLLTIIVGWSEHLLAQEKLPAAVRKCSEEILQAATTGADLTRQLFSFARRQPMGTQTVEVNRVVTETTRLLRRLIGARVELVTTLAPEAGSVRADPSQLQQVLMNLAANARDAMPAGGRLTINTSRISRTAAQTAGARMSAGHYVMLRVADTGHGMDESIRAKLFEPFFTTKDLEKGTGLGLATVRSIVTKLGGNITVESSSGAGTCFSIYIPSNVERAEPLELKD